jgi:hypothetical protein
MNVLQILLARCRDQPVQELRSDATPALGRGDNNIFQLAVGCAEASDKKAARLVFVLCDEEKAFSSIRLKHCPICLFGPVGQFRRLPFQRQN